MALLAWLLSLVALVGGSDPAFMRTLYVEYQHGDSHGHYAFGHAIGEAMGDLIRGAWANDKELQAMEAWADTAEGHRIFSNLVGASNESFPLYTREVEGMAAGAKVPLRRLLVNQLREEIEQWLSAAGHSQRAGHCTDAYAFDPDLQISAWGHNDDWGVYWRNETYFVIATAIDADGAALFRFGSWGYPGYLPGMQLNWNSHGVVWTCNSLFPRSFLETGVGTAWVARHALEAQSVEELIRRAADARVSTAMNYNIGNLSSKALWNLEADARGVYAVRRVTGPYVHANQFKLLSTAQFPEASSSHREARWAQLKPNDVPSLRSFLSDRQDPLWPVWRNGTGGDTCFTQVTGIFDLHRRTLSVWTSPAASAPPEMELSLDFPSGASPAARRSELLV